MNDKQYILAALAIVLLAAGLRFYNLGGTSLWFDEAVYATNSQGSFAEMLEKTRTQNSSPILLPFVFWLMGDLVQSPFWIRFLPLVFGVLVVVVTLQLPRVGIPAPVALVSALWMAASPRLVEYSQEVREYSLAALIGVLLVYGFLRAMRNSSEKRDLLLPVLLFLAPLCAYGTIFLAGTLLGLLTLFDVVRGGTKFWRIMIPTLALAFGLFLSYEFTAKYQMGIAKAEYLSEGYAPGGLVPKLGWLGKATEEYFGYHYAGVKIAAICLILTVAFLFLTIRAKKVFFPEFYLVTAMVGLVVGSAGLGLSGIFPYGGRGLRQHLFATPLAILAVTSAFSWLIRGLRFRKALWLLFLFVTVAAGAFRYLPGAYSEKQNIVAAVQKIPEGIDDDRVFVYWGAIPAIQFHYPEKRLFFSKSRKGEVMMMKKEIEEFGRGRLALLFSHMNADEDGQLVSLLLADGYTLLEDKPFLGQHKTNPQTRLVILEKP